MNALDIAQEVVNAAAEGRPHEMSDGCILAVAQALVNVHAARVPNPKEGVFFWVLEVGIDKTLVADGADFTDESVHDMLMHRWPHAYGSELVGRVVSRPPDKLVAGEQGYRRVSGYLADRDRLAERTRQPPRK